ncbi:zf-HC2 domain-containing protein [bacterium]|nr:zf-HC2 domain-containing protein [bacterium]
MKLTCNQMDVLISFYIEGELSNSLKQQVEAHLSECPTCKAKFEIVDSMLKDLKESLLKKYENRSLYGADMEKNSVLTSSLGLFKTNLSAYIDNELSNEENVKLKKYAISNPKARRELESNYNIRKLMNDSFRKCKNDLRGDFSKSVIKQLELDDDSNYEFIHPVVKLIIVFTISVFIVTIIVLLSLAG